MSDERPSGGHQFEAVMIGTQGWVCLVPWVKNASGYWWRPNIALRGGFDGVARAEAESIAQQLNRVLTPTYGD